MKFFTGKLKHHHTKLVQDSRENFRGTFENREKRKSLAQRIFPSLRYIYSYTASCMYSTVRPLYPEISAGGF